MLSAIEGMSVHIGEFLIIEKYIPSLFGIIQKASSAPKMDRRNFQAILSSLILVESSLDLLTPADVTRYIASEYRALFASLLSPSTNVLIFCQLMSTVIKIGHLIGQCDAQKYLIPWVSQYFSYFSYFYDPESGEASEPVTIGPIDGIDSGVTFGGVGGSGDDASQMNQIWKMFDGEESGEMWMNATFGIMRMDGQTDAFRLPRDNLMDRKRMSDLGGEAFGVTQRLASLKTVCSPEFASILCRCVCEERERERERERDREPQGRRLQDIKIAGVGERIRG